MFPAPNAAVGEGRSAINATNTKRTVNFETAMLKYCSDLKIVIQEQAGLSRVPMSFEVWHVRSTITRSWM